METKCEGSFIDLIPVPLCTVDKEGKVVRANPAIGDVFIYDQIEGSDIFAITGVKYEKLVENASTGMKINIVRNDRVFSLSPKLTTEQWDGEENETLLVYFLDVTEYTRLREKYQNEKPCIGIINIDNYDELYSSTSENAQMTMLSKIDKTIRDWGSSLHASVVKQKESMYCLVVSYERCMAQMENKFQILDQVREIKSEADFPITLSMGFGLNGKTLDENAEFAQQALDLALGRGGDQAVVKDGDTLAYFGGRTQTVEKGNKGKSRVIGHALRRLVQNSSKVFIMGHKNPDMDAFGAAMGIHRVVKPINKETYIILEHYGEALDLLYDAAVKSEDYNIITKAKALDLVDGDSLVIVVDTHKPSITECPEILKQNVKKVVIDHHRKGEEFIEGATLVYMEPYASSTSELVTEIIQYTMEKKDISKLEAEGLLAGIFVDTNHFSVQTGVRTFEAAAWLRRAGADLASVKKFFQVGKDLFTRRAKGVSDAVFDENGNVFSICEGGSENAQMICSLVADELLQVRGTRRSFAVSKNDRGKTIISARSVGDINVQVIMERFNGGGHLNVAGAQVDMEPVEVIEEIKEILEEE